MNKIIYALSVMLLTGVFCGCKNDKAGNVVDAKDSIADGGIKDTAIYGVVGEGTSMHMLEVITADGKTLTFENGDEDSLSDVQGGIFSGDRVTLVACGTENSKRVQKLVNLTSLLGKWVSLDRNFEIKEDGSIESSQKAESNPYTQWQMCNTRIILNKDTFDIVLLGPDSLYLENNEGIFAYKRLGKTIK